MYRAAWIIVMVASSLSFGGCSVKQLASEVLADSLSGTGSAFARDDDPELIAGATPFALKTMEAVLDNTPRHARLLLALTQGFTQYAYAFVHTPADVIEERDFAAALAGRKRARRLYLRARDYGLRGLEVAHAGFADGIRTDTDAVLAMAGAADVPLLYWTAAGWASAIGLGADDPALVGELPIVEAMARRALALDEAYGGGAIHTFLMAFEMSRIGATGGAHAAATAHFERAVALSGGEQAAPYLTYAEVVATARQDRDDFLAKLDAALAIRADVRPELTLVNTVMQRRARWLRERVDELFLD